MEYMDDFNEAVTDDYENARHSTTKESINVLGLKIEDHGGFWWGAVGFLNLCVGLVLYLVMKESLPRNSEAVKTGVILGLAAVVIVALGYMFLLLSFTNF